MTGIPEGNNSFKSHSTSPLAQPAGHIMYCIPSMSAHTTAFSPELEKTNCYTHMWISFHTGITRETFKEEQMSSVTTF